MVKIKRIRNNIKNLSKGKKITYIFLSLVFLCSLVALYYFLLLPKDDTSNFDPDSYDIITYSTDRPSEKEVKEYIVPPDMPRKINLESIQKSGFIQPVGIDQYGNIAVPSNVLMAGWYVNSVKPGNEGLSIITGHRDGVMKKGVFRYLENLKEGDIFEIEYGDGTVKTFRAVDIRIESIEDTYNIMYEKRESIENQLNLVTCTGIFDRETQTYNKRVTIISEGI